MKFTKIRAPDFDLEKTLDSGQVFHWEKIGDGFVGAIGDLRCLCRATRRIFKSSLWRDAKTSTRAACAPRNCQRITSRWIIRWRRSAIRFRRTR